MKPAHNIRLEIFNPHEGDSERTLPQPTLNRLERVWGWGRSCSAVSTVFRPSTVEDLKSVFALARDRGMKIALRGTGCSYGDASILPEEISLDLTRMRRVLSWDPRNGVAEVEPGVTIEQLWKLGIEDGWWPYVVSGTMFPTLGGAAAMNIHGKNNFAVGPIGDHILDFDLLLPDGSVRFCSREQNSDLFHAAIGGFGMLGCFTRLRIELKRVYSGNVRVTPISARNLSEMFHIFEERLPQSDYLVGWVDCFSHGDRLGRGLVHQANYLAEGDDPSPQQSLRVVNQDLPDSFFFGSMAKSTLWRKMRWFVNKPGMRLTNWAKYISSIRSSGHSHLQSHAAFAFLLDYAPNWKLAYGKGGLIQYQSFIPKEHAERVFRAQIELQHKHGLPSYLGVLKRHRPDDFWMTHALDGYSLALDFKVTERNCERLWKLAGEMDRLVVEAGGRFYYAKDSTLSPKSLGGYLQEERVKRFLSLKREVDPDEMLQTALYRRVFGESG